MIPFFVELLVRFRELHADIEKNLDPLPQEAMDWTPGPDMNSVSVLVIHLTGSERFWVGDVVMGDPSNRVREAEFQVSGLDKATLLQRLRETEAYLTTAFDKLKLTDLETTRIHPLRGYEVTVAWALMHALEHTGIHLGHIELTAQLWKQRQG